MAMFFIVEKKPNTHMYVFVSAVVFIDVSIYINCANSNLNYK